MYPALLARLSGRPMALAPRALDALLAWAPEARAPVPVMGEDRDSAGYSVTAEGIAVVPVLGPPRKRTRYPAPRSVTTTVAAMSQRTLDGEVLRVTTAGGSGFAASAATAGVGIGAGRAAAKEIAGMATVALGSAAGFGVTAWRVVAEGPAFTVTGSRAAGGWLAGGAGDRGAAGFVPSPFVNTEVR